MNKAAAASFVTESSFLVRTWLTLLLLELELVKDVLSFWYFMPVLTIVFFLAVTMLLEIYA